MSQGSGPRPQAEDSCEGSGCLRGAAARHDAQRKEEDASMSIVLTGLLSSLSCYCDAACRACLLSVLSLRTRLLDRSSFARRQAHYDIVYCPSQQETRPAAEIGGKT